MKSFFRHAIFSSISLYVLSRMFPAIVFRDSSVVLIAGFVLALVMMTVKPVLHILLLPVNIVTFGMFSWVIHILLLFIVDWLVPGFSIGRISTPLIAFGGMEIAPMYLSAFWSLFVVAFFLSMGNSILGSLL